MTTTMTTMTTMTSGADLPRIPGPPHDPLSILLNGRIGFRAIPPAAGVPAAVVDDACCALTLPRLPSALRDLAEPSGSLGGIRPPSNVALGPDGSVYLLDRVGLTLKRFDPCMCAFATVPCLGGEGGGVRQLRNPGGIAIACGNVYVCDTGLEAAPAGDACDDQSARDRRVRGENHRVSVFALKGFALRGHLAPPPDRRPWRPSSVAVDSLGRVWVGDLTGRLHRFTPGGAWEREWPAVPAPAHLAIDRRDRVYLVSPGAVPPVRVLDAEARAVADAPRRPGDARRDFPPLPFAVDALGRLHLQPCCDPCAGCKRDAGAELVFGASGEPVEVKANALDPVFMNAATYRCDALDSGIAECVWHRVALYGALPTGTRVRVRAFAADERHTGAELDAFAAWRDCAVADAFDEAERWDCLVRADPGRYLWIELALEGDGVATPAIGAIVVEYPRVSLRRFLPAVFGAEPVSADFTDRFLALFDTPLRSIERQVDDGPALYDPNSAPASAADPRKLDFLSWLGSWIGVTMDRNWDVATRRRLLKRAGALLDRRGTLRGLREQLLVLLGFDRLAPCAAEERACGRCAPAPRNCAPPPEPVRFVAPPLVLEHFRLRRWLRLGTARLGAEAVVWGERIVGRTRLGAHGQLAVTRLDTTPDPELDPFLVQAHQFSVFVPAACGAGGRARKALENLMKAESPAGTRGYLHLVEPRFRIGVQSMLGFDSVVGAVPQGVALGTTPLGAASVLTAPPHRQGGPAIALGEEGRIGTTTLLT